MKWVTRTAILLAVALLFVGGFFALDSTGIFDSLDRGPGRESAEHAAELGEELGEEHSEGAATVAGGETESHPRRGMGQGREHVEAGGFSLFELSRNLGIIAVIVLLFIAVDWMRLRVFGRRRNKADGANA